jgi:hypothetical protein
MSGCQNFCELYVSLIPHHENLKYRCESLSNVLKNEKERREEIKKNEFKENIQIFLKNLIEKLFENLELLKLVAFDFGSDYVSFQSNLKSIQNDLKANQEKLDAINEKIDKQQKTANFEIHTMREDFLKKFQELMDSKTNYEENQKKLDKNCKVKIELEEKLNCKREELKKVLCQIKKQRLTMEPNVPMSDFDELRDYYEKSILKLSQLSSTVECYQSKLAQTQLENEIMRKIFKSKLKVIRAHDKYITDELIKRKDDLENKIEQICVDESDYEIKKIGREIFIMQQKIEISEVSMEELSKVINKFQAYKRPCQSLSAATLKRLREEKALVFGVDYQGSKFVKFRQ